MPGLGAGGREAETLWECVTERVVIGDGAKWALRGFRARTGSREVECRCLFDMDFKSALGRRRRDCCTQEAEVLEKGGGGAWHRKAEELQVLERGWPDARGFMKEGRGEDYARGHHGCLRTNGLTGERGNEEVRGDSEEARIVGEDCRERAWRECVDVRQSRTSKRDQCVPSVRDAGVNHGVEERRLTSGISGERSESAACRG